MRDSLARLPDYVCVVTIERAQRANSREVFKPQDTLRLEVALDVAFQCSPDHPYVTEHPQWFRWRPDRTVQFAEKSSASMTVLRLLKN